MPTAISRWIYQFSSDHWSQAASSPVSTWMGDRLGTRGAVGISFCEISPVIKSMTLHEKKKRKRKKFDANSTQCSQAVTHPSTNRAQHCLTSVIGRELVCSMWYGRWREVTSILDIINLDLEKYQENRYWNNMHCHLASNEFAKYYG